MQQVIPFGREGRMPPRVALVHDYLVQDGGAERVLQAFQELFPDAPTFTLFYDPERSHPAFQGKDIRTSMLGRWAALRGREEWVLPLMPVATEHMNFSEFDLIISSSSSFAKGIIAPPGSLHICYLHTPTRFLWEDRMSYVNDLPQPRFIKRLLPYYLHRLRMWDRLAAERPDVIVTNSETSRRRIYRYYNRDSHVISPPVDVSRIPKVTRAGTYWLTGGRLVSYKRFDLTVTAFAKLGLPLKIFGSGPEIGRLKKLAGPRTDFIGKISDNEKINLLTGCIGFIHPQIEDFGITAVEAMAAGKPVIGFGVGGGRETIVPGITGELLEEQTWEDLGDLVIRFDPTRYDPIMIRMHAERFRKERFLEQFGAFVDRWKGV